MMADHKTSEYWPRFQLTRATFCAIAVHCQVFFPIEMIHSGISNIFIAICAISWIKNSAIGLVVTNTSGIP